EYVRFHPDLEAGTYDVYFTAVTPFDPMKRIAANGRAETAHRHRNEDPGLNVRIVSKTGDRYKRVTPKPSTHIGTFEFYEGMDGYVDILSDGSTGQVLADAIVFRKVSEPPGDMKQWLGVTLWGPKYHLTTDPVLLEGAKKAAGMGAKLFKI